MNDQQSSSRQALRFSRTISGHRVWLAAGRRVVILDDEYRIFGYITDSCLGQEAHWRRRTGEVRDALEQRMLQDQGARLEQALEAAIVDITGYLEACKAEGLEPNLRKLREFWSCGDLDLGAVGKGLAQSLNDLRAKQRHRDLAEQIGRSLKLSDYPDTFPVRRRARKLIAVLGPTNSGKTHDAFERLVTASSGVYLGPLRLLALEAFTRLNEEFGVSASLITGEERRIVEGSRVTASTIEMLDPGTEIEVAVIDEIQMLSDPDRGWAWTQAVVGANAREVWLVGALSAEPAIIALAARLGLPLEIRRKARKHPLSVGQPLANDAAGALRRARPGDAFIVFSRRDALNLRDDLLALGKSVACIYGALSPEVREREAHRFAGGDADILVATDAIGMGLNLPIQRVVFTAVQKYDGTTRDTLSPSLLQQIGGRAGRFGHQEEEGLVAGLTPAEHKVVTSLMKAPQPPLETMGFQITPGSAYLEQLADMHLAPWISVVDGHLRSRYRQGVGGGRKGIPSWYWPVRH